MHAQESHPGLAKAYFKLGHVIQSVADFHAQQSTAESTTLRDLLQYHSADAFIVKETLTNRQILLREYLQAQAATHSKRVAADRVRSSSTVKRERADDALAALDDAQATEDALRERTQRVTANLVQDRRRWFARTAADLKLALRDYTVRQIEAERRTLATLESVRPEIRSIDASGGLSRLGREALGLPPVAAGAGSGSGTVEGRRSSRVGGLGASQGPKGDSWSGVPRPAGGLNRSLSASVQSVGGQDGDDGVGGGGEAGGLASPGGTVREGEGGLEFDGDRVDARNAASRLAQSTF